MPKNVQFDNLRVNGKNEPFYVGPSLLIHTDPDNLGCQNFKNGLIYRPKFYEKFQILKYSKWLPENYKGLQNVLAKIKGLNIFEKTLRELEVNKPKLHLPMVTKVQGQRSLDIIFQQNRYIYIYISICP
jgi:hypothetical protein